MLFSNKWTILACVITISALLIIGASCDEGKELKKEKLDKVREFIKEVSSAN